MDEEEEEEEEEEEGGGEKRGDFRSMTSSLRWPSLKGRGRRSGGSMDMRGGNRSNVVGKRRELGRVERRGRGNH